MMRIAKSRTLLASIETSGTTPNCNLELWFCPAFSMTGMRDNVPGFNLVDTRNVLKCKRRTHTANGTYCTTQT